MQVTVLGQGSRTVGTVYCIGRNYAAHAAELGNAVPSAPVVFLKAATTLRIPEAGPVAFPDEVFHHELELVLLLGEGAPLGSRPGWGAVAAATLGIDLTRRGIQSTCKAEGRPWTPAKSFAGSAIVAPFVPLAELGPVDALSYSLSVGGQARQHGQITDMVFDVPTVLTYLASLAPLCAGDLVFTGTPEGVGPLAVGDPFLMTLNGASGRHEFAGML